MYDRLVKYVGRVLIALLVLAAFAWTGAVAFIWANETRIVYRAQWTRSCAPFEGTQFRPVEIAEADGFNGAAGSIHRRRYREHLAQRHVLGYNVLSFDYRGFSRAPGTPSEEGVYADALAAVRVPSLSVGAGGPAGIKPL